MYMIYNELRKVAEALKESARKGMLRYIEDFVAKEDLPAKDWQRKLLLKNLE